MFKPLPRSFYAPSAREVAPKLLGHWLLRRTPDGFSGGPIVETEAYLMGDPASHGFVGETQRNRVMYGPAGYAYVYFIYGTHFCVNAVCRKKGHAEAVLIRAIEAEVDLEWMRLNRLVEKTPNLSNGPGKLCAALRIDRQLDGADLASPDSELIIAANPKAKSFCKMRGPMVVTTRIGLSRAAEMDLRFYLGGSPFISRRARATSP